MKRDYHLVDANHRRCEATSLSTARVASLVAVVGRITVGPRAMISPNFPSDRVVDRISTPGSGLPTPARPRARLGGSGEHRSRLVSRSFVKLNPEPAGSSSVDSSRAEPPLIR